MGRDFSDLRMIYHGIDPTAGRFDYSILYDVKGGRRFITAGTGMR